MKETHFLRGNPKETHAELKGNPVTGLNSQRHLLLKSRSEKAILYCSVPIWSVVFLIIVRRVMLCTESASFPGPFPY